MAGGCVRAVREQAFELQRAPDALVGLMRQLAIEVGMAEEARHAVTMTAELSQMFRANATVWRSWSTPSCRPSPTHNRCLHGRRHLRVAGGRADVHRSRLRPPTGWQRLLLLRRIDPDALLIDVGSTTTDLVRILDRRIVAAGRMNAPIREAMRRAWAALEAGATEAGHAPLAPEVWETRMPDGTVLAVVRTQQEAHALARDSHERKVWTLDEVGRVVCAPWEGRRWVEAVHKLLSRRPGRGGPAHAAQRRSSTGRRATEVPFGHDTGDTHAHTPLARKARP